MQVLALRHLGGLLIPRPLSFLANTLHFGGGMFFAWLEVHNGYPFIGAGPGQPHFSLRFILAWFIIQELLVQQAKYTWNDLRDHERDRQLPANRHRPLAQRPPSRRLYFLLAARWLLGIALAALLSPKLLAIVLLLSALQIIYEHLGKPYASRLPVLPLLIVGAGAALKFLGGALALGWPLNLLRLWLYGLALFGTGIVYGSSCWRVEAEEFRRRGRRLPRGQSGHFAAWGMLWLLLGAAVGVSACLLLLGDALGGLPLAPALAGQPVPLRASAALLLLFVLVYDYLLNYRADYRQFNLLYLFQNLPALRAVVAELRDLRPRPATITAFVALVLAVNSSQFALRLARYRRRVLH